MKQKSTLIKQILAALLTLATVCTVFASCTLGNDNESDLNGSDILLGESGDQLLGNEPENGDDDVTIGEAVNFSSSFSYCNCQNLKTITVPKRYAEQMKAYFPNSKIITY